MRGHIADSNQIEKIQISLLTNAVTASAAESASTATLEITNCCKMVFSITGIEQETTAVRTSARDAVTTSRKNAGA